MVKQKSKRVRRFKKPMSKKTIEKEEETPKITFHISFINNISGLMEGIKNFFIDVRPFSSSDRKLHIWILEGTPFQIPIFPSKTEEKQYYTNLKGYQTLKVHPPLFFREGIMYGNIPIGVKINDLLYLSFCEGGDKDEREDLYLKHLIYREEIPFPQEKITINIDQDLINFDYKKVVGQVFDAIESKASSSQTLAPILSDVNIKSTIYKAYLYNKNPNIEYSFDLYKGVFPNVLDAVFYKKNLHALVGGWFTGEHFDVPLHPAHLLIKGKGRREDQCFPLTDFTFPETPFYHPHVTTEFTVCWGEDFEDIKKRLATYDTTRLLPYLDTFFQTHNYGHGFTRMTYLFYCDGCQQIKNYSNGFGATICLNCKKIVCIDCCKINKNTGYLLYKDGVLRITYSTVAPYHVNCTDNRPNTENLILPEPLIGLSNIFKKLYKGGKSYFLTLKEVQEEIVKAKFEITERTLTKEEADQITVDTILHPFHEDFGKSSPNIYLPNTDSMSPLRFVLRSHRFPSKLMETRMREYREFRETCEYLQENDHNERYLNLDLDSETPTGDDDDDWGEDDE